MHPAQSTLKRLGAAAGPAVLVGIVAGFVLLGQQQDKRADSECDNAFVALNRSVASEVDGLLSKGISPCGARSYDAIVDCLVASHADLRNPRNRREPEYVKTTPTPCQVRLFVNEHPRDDGSCREFGPIGMAQAGPTRTAAICTDE